MAGGKKKKLKGIAKVIIGLLVFLIIVVGIIVYIISHKKEPIPEGYMGNTGGNLNNHGLFCENDGWIYFSNSYNQSKLYKMKTDLSEVTQLTDVPVEYINVYDDTVYFYQTPGAEGQIFGLGGLYGICYTDINGKTGLNNIDKAICNGLILYGPHLYYQHYENTEGLTLYKAEPDKSGKAKISDKDVNITCPLNGKFLCYDKDNQYCLSAYNEETDKMELISGKIRAYNIIKEGDYLYYMSVDDHYKIYRYSLSSGNIEKITDFTVDIFNVYGDYIFAQLNSETNPQLVHMKSDGSHQSVVAEGNFTNINCTSTYTFFYNFEGITPIYYVPTIGGTAQIFELGN